MLAQPADPDVRSRVQGVSAAVAAEWDVHADGLNARGAAITQCLDDMTQDSVRETHGETTNQFGGGDKASHLPGLTLVIVGRRP